MGFSRRTFIQLGSLPLLGACVDLSKNPIVGRMRARQMGIRIGYLPTGRWNAITDVAGVEVGHSTIIRGDGELQIGAGPVRTGVTAIWPSRNIVNEYLPCGVDAPNGNGELSGMLQARQMGVLASPLCLTNTSSVGMVYDELLKLQPTDDLPPGIPVVGETWDGSLNDILGRHVHGEHVKHALDSAASGPVEEGAVGGGTGMICYDFKGGIGSASRRVVLGDSLPEFTVGAARKVVPGDDRPEYTVGALVQVNHGWRFQLRIDGVPVGEELPPAEDGHGDLNWILMLIATDAPLLSHQLDRIARRATHGLAKTGSISSNGSGDFTLAFSTSNPIARDAFWRGDTYPLRSVEQFDIGPLLQAASEAVEESIINALCMATDMVGINGRRVPALPLNRTREIMHAHGRLFEAEATAGENADV